LETVGDHYEAIGEHSDVWAGAYREAVGASQVAIKVLRGGSPSNTQLIRKLQKFLDEHGSRWRRLNHNNVGEFIGISNKYGYMPAIVLRYYEYGNIIKYLENHSGISDLDRLGFIFDIAAGLAYLHGEQIIHADLRGANILMDSRGNPRICDYELALIIEQSEFTSAKTVGNCRWAAPEVLNPPDDWDEEQELLPPFTFESDVYAFSMTVIEIATLKVPFSNRKNDSSVIFAVLNRQRPHIPPFVAEHNVLHTLIQECWDQSPSLRPSSSRVSERLEVYRRPSQQQVCIFDRVDFQPADPKCRSKKAVCFSGKLFPFSHLTQP
ncbi:hypothetical protein JAAARDRAFT_129693, partial [Jaapia argillacea MUCL 33604]